MSLSDSHLDMPSVIKRARSAVMDDPAHNLAPFYRAMIYSLIGSPNVRLQDPDGMQVTLFQVMDRS
jgi:hypothetical protein